VSSQASAGALPREFRIAGLMSGTSVDGIDAAIVRFEGAGDELEWWVDGFLTIPYGSARRDRILHAMESATPREIARLHVEVGEWFAEAVHDVCEAAGLTMGDLDAIGSHGHTLWHDPPLGEVLGASFQLGDPARIAERTGVQVVSDFRARDVAAGGHGAPLVPWADALLFTHPERARVIQNIGGMANVTWLPAGASEPPFAFDTGPGVALIDEAARIATNHEQRMDRDGRMAAAGTVDERLLTGLLQHRFFTDEPPRSTGRELFGRALLERMGEDLAPREPSRWNDLVATLTELTVHSIADAYRRWILPRGVDELFVTGGGAHNPVLMEGLRRALEPLEFRPGAELGVDPDAREAVAFAALAWAHLNGEPSNVPGSTGAAGPRILGSRTPGRRG